MTQRIDETKEVAAAEGFSRWRRLRFWISIHLPRTYRVGGLVARIWRRLWHPMPTFRWLRETAGDIARRRQESRLTVAVDVAPFWEPLTGVGWYLYRLLESLAERDDLRLRLYGPTIVASGDVAEPVVDIPTGSALELVSYPITNDLLLPDSLAARFLRKAEPLLIAADRNKVLFAPNFFLPRRYNLAQGARVATIHDLGFRKVPWTLRNETLRELRGRLEHSCFEAVRLITDSAAVRDELSAFGYARPDRVRAIHLGPGQVAGVEPGPLPPGTPDTYALHVGTLEPRKNILALLEAWRALGQKIAEPPALVFCGQFGWKADAIRREVKRGEREGWVHHLGYVSESELAALYRHAALVVLPSLYEGFGLPALEAMCAGVPLVCSDIPVLREVAGDAALYAPADRPEDLAKQIARVLIDSAVRNDLVRRGSKRSQQFDWQRTARETVEIWHEAAGAQQDLGKVEARGWSSGEARSA